MKINNKYLKHLVDEPLVYFIYQSDLSIFGLESDKIQYNIFTDSKYETPKEFIKNITCETDGKVSTVEFDNCYFYFQTVDKLFDRIINNDLQVYELLFLNKKYIYKEYIKLMFTIDIYKLRLSFDNIYKQNIDLYNNNYKIKFYDTAKYYLWKNIKFSYFFIQLLINNKITNYKSANNEYNILKNCENDKIYETYLKLIDKNLSYIKDHTDNLKLQHIINKK